MSSTTNMRPFSSNAIATGEITSGSAATNSTRNPGSVLNDASACSGVIGPLIAGAQKAEIAAHVNIIQRQSNKDFFIMRSSLRFAGNHIDFHLDSTPKYRLDGRPGRENTGTHEKFPVNGVESVKFPDVGKMHSTLDNITQ